MATYYDDLFDGLKRAGQLMAEATVLFRQATETLSTAGERQTEALSTLVGVADAALHAHGEHEDLRDTVQRLEGLVMDLVRDVRLLRDQKNGSN